MKNINTVHTTLRYVLYALAVLPAFIFRDFTLDNELRYLSIADEALRNGSIFTFTNHGIPYADKPPLYIWIVMLGKLLFGNHNLLFLGIFSYLPALVVLYIMDKWVKDVLSERDRLIGQLMLLTSGFFLGSAVVLRMDMLMCMFIVFSLYTFFRMYNGSTKRLYTLLFPFFVFMALFTKGPLGILIPLISTIAFLIINGEIKTIGRYWGWKTLMVLFILCGAWFAGVYAEGGIQYLNNLLFNQTVNRAINSFHHKEPIYYYLTSSLYSLAPWSLLYAGVFWMRLKNRLATTKLELFFLVIALSTFITLSLISAKLQIYLLPAFPFITYLFVLWIVKIDTRKWMLPLLGFPSVILSMALPALIVAQRFVDTNEKVTSPFNIAAAMILSLTGLLSLRYLINSKLSHGIITISAGVLLAIFTISFAIPKYNSFIGLKELCLEAKKTATIKRAENYYYCEISKGDNLDVYLGVKLEMLKIKDLYNKESPIRKPAMLFLWQKAIERNDSLQMFIKNKLIHKSGNYYFIEI
jgi:4-amino-4-deoxy-L-arabinose transferase-like glycosyltransferase